MLSKIIIFFVKIIYCFVIVKNCLYNEIRYVLSINVIFYLLLLFNIIEIQLLMK